MHHADVRMIECRGRSRFPLEAFEGDAVVRQLLRQELQRDQAAESDVLRFVNHAHAPAPETAKNAITRDRFALQGKLGGTNHLTHRCSYLIPSASRAGKQRLHLAPQLRISTTGIFQQAGALVRLALDGAMEQLFDLCPTFGSQAVPILAFRCAATNPPFLSRDGP